MSETTPRQVLYALVALGFMLVVLVLVIGTAAAGITPSWWSIIMGAATIFGLALLALRWRRTGLVLGVSMALLAIWATGTLLLA